MAGDDLCYLGAAEALAAFKARKLSPVELMRAVIARAEVVEPRINAFTASFFEQALEQARKAEARYMKTDGRTRPLEGLPTAIKDESYIKGQVTTKGSLVLRDAVAPYTSLVAERLLRAGAIVHARTATPEFSCIGVTHSRLHGITRNPWNTHFTPGGSSGGAAAALAAGSTTLANGSDIGGSIRIPASACGLAGFKPPYGRNPDEPPFSLDFYCHTGPLARSVRDCAVMQNVMAGPHPRDIVSLRPKLRIPDRLGDIKGWRIAYSLDLGYAEIDSEVAANTLAAVETLRSAGATVEAVDLGWSWSTLTAAMNYLGHLFGASIVRYFTRHRHELTDYAIAFAEAGQRVSTDDFFASLEVAGEMYGTLGPILEKYRILLCPTLAVPAVPADHNPARDRVEINGVEVAPELGWCLTYPFNMMSRCPVLSVPSGQAANGVPTGVQIVGRTYDDVSVFRAAAALEAADPWYTAARRPKL